MTKHIPVLIKDFFKHVDVSPNGIYVDCTYGGGGYSAEILKRLGDKGKLYAFDQDGEAEKHLLQDERLYFFRYNFKYIDKILRLEEVQQVDGIVADLGMSSFQIDCKERGFSFQNSTTLDMRMDDRMQMDAWTAVQTLNKNELENIFREYGEIPQAKKLAYKICEEKKDKNSSEGFDLLVRLSATMNARKPKQYLARIFQALRIYVNDELEALQELLHISYNLLKPQAWMAVISFHSLEDRIVKRCFKNWKDYSYKIDMESEIYQNKQWEEVISKPIQAKYEEIKRNSRSSSAKLRIAKKI